MKTKVFLVALIAICFVTVGYAQQKINVQNKTKTEFYDDLPTAIQKAVSGDTIYLPGAVISAWNDLIIDKQLTIIGAGCDVDSIGGLQTTEIIRLNGGHPKITFSNGSDGSLLMGCIVGDIQFGRYDENNVPLHNIQNVTIFRNKISSINLEILGSAYSQVKNIFIKENQVELSINGNGAADCSITNNLMVYMVGNNGGMKNFYITNNVITGEVSGLADACRFENNFLFYFPTSPFLSGFSNCIFNNNAFAGNYTFPVGSNTGSNNLMDQSGDQTFEVYYGATSPKNFKIRATSPCKNAGTDGTDIGIFGGPAPFKAVPFNPHINKASIAAQTDKDGKLKVDIQVTANNIVKYEYWMDNDYDSKVQTNILPVQTFNWQTTIPCQNLDVGFHTLNVRFMDASGLWSSTLTAVFYQAISVSVGFTFTRSVLPGVTPATENGYPDYASVSFILYNITKKKDVTNSAFQYPDIVLSQLVNVGDSISITAVSNSFSNGFDPITKKIVVEENNNAPVIFNIVQRGIIQSKYQSSANDANVGIVYDSIGNRVAQYDYINQTLTTDALPDGTYQLVSMAKSLNFNSMQNLSDFASTQLLQNTHYILQKLTVKTGVITAATVAAIPKFDENQLIYTTNNTLFSVNKSTIAIGNFVTLRGAVEFKEEYRGKVGNLKLIVDIPDSCSFFDQSVMIGDSVYSEYLLQNKQLIVPLVTDSDIVHFCITPKQAGSYSPNAFIEFTLNGKKIGQPIGAANFTVEGSSIFVPSVTAKKAISVRGVTTAKSLVNIYDGDEWIGQTTALADGNWKTPCNLSDVNIFPFHYIHAEITTPKGQMLQTETKEVIYDETNIDVAKVTQYNTAHRSSDLVLQEYVVEFNFLNPPTKGGVYWYWPEYPDFTFTIEFTKNDPNVITDVRLDVLVSSGEIVTLPATYNDAKQLWVATGKFDSYHMPRNVSVRYKNNRIY